jgi:hypothetical protein
MSAVIENPTTSVATLSFSVLHHQLVGNVGGTSFNVSATTGENTWAGMGSIGNRSGGGQLAHINSIPIGQYHINAPTHNAFLGWSSTLSPMAGTVIPGFLHEVFYLFGGGPHLGGVGVSVKNPNDLSSLLTALEKSKGGTLTVTH